eukprot:184715_1
MSAFAIRLNGPSSTSKQLEVAIKFATTDGIIIQLNNKKSTSVAERFFNCSWISRYGVEENERLFFGGRFKLEIESVRIRDIGKEGKKWRNYGTVMNALYSFDSMLSGDCSMKTKIKGKDIDTLVSLMNYFLEKDLNKFDKYVSDTFYLFCNGKTQITLNLDDVYHNITKPKFIQLLMYSVRQWKTSGKISYFDAMYKKDNLFKPMLFQLFKQLKEIIIYAQPAYLFHLRQFLSIITSSSRPKSLSRITIKTTQD